MQIELHVGIGSEHEVRERFTLGGKDAVNRGSRACLPQGQWVIREGERGQESGFEEGGWHGFEQ